MTTPINLQMPDLDNAPDISEKEFHVNQLIRQLSFATELRIPNIADRIRLQLMNLGVTKYNQVVRRIEIEKPFVPFEALPILSRDELAIWAAFLPTIYSGQMLIPYDEDMIPFSILHDWTWWKRTKTFEQIQIWTPTIRHQDPILLGRIKDSWYLIARWAESEEVLISFSEIKRIIADRIKRMKRNKFMMKACLIISLFGLLIAPLHGFFTFLFLAGLIGFGVSFLRYLSGVSSQALESAERALIALG